MNTTQYPMTTEAVLAAAEREASNPNVAAWASEQDDSDEAFDFALAECLAADQAAR